MSVHRGTYSTHGLQSEEQALPFQRGEQALWRAVIDRAMDDACGHCGSEGQYNQKEIIIDRAAAWLLGTGQDMSLVCDLAELHPQLVKNRAVVMIAEAADAPPQRKKHKNVRYVTGKKPGPKPKLH